MNREFAKILRDNGYKRHDDADSSDSESSAAPSPVKRTRKTRRSKKESGFAFEVLTNGRPESILMFGEHASPTGRPSMTRSSMNGSGRPRAVRTLFKTGDHIGHDILPTQRNLEGGTDGEDFIEAIADSGATSHAFRPDDVAKIGFDNVKELPNTVVVDAHGGESRVKQRADLPAIAIDFASGKRGNSMLEDAMVVEKLRKNLLSIPKLVQKKHIVVFAHEEDGGSYIKMRGRTDRIPLKWKRNAWVLRIYAESKKTSAQTKQRTNFLTHRKFAHVGRRALDLALRRNMLTGFKYHKLSKAEACKCSVCTKAMSKRAPFSKQSKTRSRLPGAVVHVDFAEVPVASRNGNKLAAIFTDDCVRYRVADYAKTSKGVHHLLQRYIDTCEERGFRLKVVRCDTQWVTDAARALARKVGFVFKASAPMCQSQDGVAERFMLTWANRVRAILRDQQRGPEYWEYASDTWQLRSAIAFPLPTTLNAHPGKVGMDHNQMLNIFVSHYATSISMCIARSDGRYWRERSKARSCLTGVARGCSLGTHTTSGRTRSFALTARSRVRLSTGGMLTASSIRSASCLSRRKPGHVAPRPNQPSYRRNSRRCCRTLSPLTMQTQPLTTTTTELRRKKTRLKPQRNRG